MYTRNQAIADMNRRQTSLELHTLEERFPNAIVAPAEAGGYDIVFKDDVEVHVDSAQENIFNVLNEAGFFESLAIH